MKPFSKRILVISFFKLEQEPQQHGDEPWLHFSTLSDNLLLICHKYKCLINRDHPDNIKKIFDFLVTSQPIPNP